METHGTITPKFQVHIPKVIREKAGITTHGPVRMKADQGMIIIEPLKGGLLSLAGKYRDKMKSEPVDLKKLRDMIDYSDL